MPKQLKIGIACCVRKTFDYEAAQKMYKQRIAALKKDYSEITWLAIDEVVIEQEDAVRAAQGFAQGMVDALVLVSGTFHLGYLALEVYKRLPHVPMLLWGMPELPYDGGRIRLNSAVGVHLDASNLYKAGVDVHVHIGDEIDAHWVQALRSAVYLGNCKLGVFGSHAHSFYNFGVEDLHIFKVFSTLLHFYDLKLLYSAEVEEKAVQAYQEKFSRIFAQGTVSHKQIEKSARLAASMKQCMDENKLDGMALRCWPEFAQEYGMAPYAAMSMLQGEGYVIANEGDVEGLISMMVGKTCSAMPPALMDISQIYEDDTALLWHMGEAAYTLADEDARISLDSYFAGGKGVTADFVLQRGEVTLFRIDSARGQTRLYMARGEIENTTQSLKGTYARVSIAGGARAAFYTMVQRGFGHHVVCAYGNHTKTLNTLAAILHIEIIS